jgi:membrane AbrB-like protein
MPLNILLTLLAGGVFGVIFIVLKIPNGLRIGAMLGSALLGVFFNIAYMPSPTRILVQVIAGALIGCTIEKGDLKRLPQVIKPMCIMLLTFLTLNIAAGFLITRVSPLDLVTALMCAIPGGVTDTPIVAADMGADTPKVALAQLARYIMGVGFFPPMILSWDNWRKKKSGDEEAGCSGSSKEKRETSKVKSPWAFVCTMVVGIGAGLLGSMSHIPAGTFLFAIIAVLILKLAFDFAYIPAWVKKFALLISGCYIGSAITMDDVHGFKLLALPIAIIVAGYIVNCFFTGKILSSVCGFNRKEGMLITTPAGASDIALSTADMGIENTDIIIIQILRSIIAMSIFPQIINIIVAFTGA